MTARPRGRYAPTPSGWIHVGNARTALVAWLSVRATGGSLVWRLEDLDPPREMPGAADAAIADLRWLGLDWDEGPDEGGPYAPYVQSERTADYDAALRRLAETERLFPCSRSRKELREIARAPHRRAAGGTVAHPAAYPRALRPTRLDGGWFERFGTEGDGGAALRFLVDDGPVRFVDRLQGEVVERVDETVGDFVLKRRDGLYAYQLAVVVDDLAMGITDVVRGMDLIDSTARQIQLIEALGGTPPKYGHVPLVLNPAGEKISKRDGGLTLRALRDAGVAPETLVGQFAWSLGLFGRPEPCRPVDLIERFRWDRLRQEPWILPAGF
ncbi:MAG: tRNA glutamyl-Q(34) synthetase GluQRS [Acidobacteriota bacterium]